MGRRVKPRHQPEAESRNTTGRPSLYRAVYVRIAERLCVLGATDKDLAAAFGVGLTTIERWQAKHPAFRGALKIGKSAADERVARSLYQRAVGYSFDSEKVHYDKETGWQRTAIVEHVP